MNTERNNIMEIGEQDLAKTIDEIFFAVKNRSDVTGLPRLHYQDQYDEFWLLIQPSNLGYQISCTLNNRQAYQLNNRFFNRSEKIGAAMLIAAGAPKGATIESFFAEA